MEGAGVGGYFETVTTPSVVSEFSPLVTLPLLDLTRDDWSHECSRSETCVFVSVLCVIVIMCCHDFLGATSHAHSMNILVNI